MTEYRSCLILVVHRESSTLCSLKNAYIVVDNAPAPITPIRFHDWVLSLYIKDDVPKWDRRSGLFRDNDGNGFTTAICVKSQDQEIIIDTNDFMFYETDIPDASNEREPNYDEILPIYIRTRYQLLLYGDLTNSLLINRIFLCGMCHCLSYCMAMVCDRYDVYVVNGDVKNAIGGHSFVYDRLLKNYSDILGPVDESLIQKAQRVPLGECINFKDRMQCYQTLSPIGKYYVKYVANVLVPTATNLI